MTHGAVRVLGSNDEQTTCDRCGKVELRGTVILGDSDYNETGRYGTTCASKILGWALTRQRAQLAESERRSNVRAYITEARTAVGHGVAGWALWCVREIRTYHCPHLASEQAALTEIESAFPGVDAGQAIAAYQSGMRAVQSVASGAGTTIGYRHILGSDIYPTAQAAYVAHIATTTSGRGVHPIV